MISKHRHKHLFFNAAKLLMGTGGSQVITIVSLPFLTRIYGTGDFGYFGTFVSITTLAAIFLTLRYEIAIPIPKDADEAHDIYDLARTSALVNAAAIVAIVAVVSRFVSLPYPAPLLFLTPATAAICASVICSEAWLARNRRYSTVARSRIIGALVTIAIQLSAGVSKTLRPHGLILGYAAGMTVTFFLETFDSRSLGRINPKQRRSIFVVARKYSDFPKYLLVAQSMNSATNQLPVIFFQHHFGNEIAGLYFAASRALSVIDLIPTSVGQVFFNDFAAKRAHGERSHEILVHTTWRLGIAGLVIFAFIFMFSSQIFNLALGNDWGGASTFAKILIPMYFIRFFTVPANLVYSCFDAQRVFLVRQITAFFFVLIALVAGLRIGFESTVAFYCIALSICYLFDLGYCMNQSRQTDLSLTGSQT